MKESHIWDLLAKEMVGNITNEEQEKLENLLKAHPDLKQSAFYLNRLNIKVEADLPLTEEEKEDLKRSNFQQVMKELDVTEDFAVNKKRKRKKLKKILVAASLLVLIGMASFFVLERSSEQQSQIAGESNNGFEEIFKAPQVTSIVLEDGTNVWLNRGSVLECDKGFGKKNRKVTLKGEAFFDVAQNATLPFIVSLKKGIKIKVLGTRFNLQSYRNSPFIEATLLSGKIALDLASEEMEKIVMKPKQKVRIEVNPSLKEVDDMKQITKIERQWVKENPIDHKIPETAWMDNRLSFNNMSFEDLSYQLERIYGVDIVFKDKKLKQYHLTGSFKQKSLKHVLEALQFTTPFKYKKRGNKITLEDKN